MTNVRQKHDPRQLTGLAAYLFEEHGVVLAPQTPEHPATPFIVSDLTNIDPGDREWRSVTLTTPSGDRDDLDRDLASFADRVADPLVLATEREHGRWHAHGLVLTSKPVDALKRLWRALTGASRRALTARRLFRGFGKSEASRAEAPAELARVVNYALKSEGAADRILATAYTPNTCDECGCNIDHKRSHAKRCDRCKNTAKQRRRRARRRAEAEEAKGGTLLDDLRRIGGDLVDELRRRLARLAPLAATGSLCPVPPYLDGVDPVATHERVTADASDPVRDLITTSNHNHEQENRPLPAEPEGRGMASGARRAREAHRKEVLPCPTPPVTIACPGAKSSTSCSAPPLPNRIPKSRSRSSLRPDPRSRASRPRTAGASSSPWPTSGPASKRGPSPLVSTGVRRDPPLRDLPEPEVRRDAARSSAREVLLAGLSPGRVAAGPPRGRGRG
ncbi:MAG: hypothetical protein R3B72_36055 [Polyangiaceae bacterium]